MEKLIFIRSNNANVLLVNHTINLSNNITTITRIVNFQKKESYHLFQLIMMIKKIIPLKKEVAALLILKGQVGQTILHANIRIPVHSKKYKNISLKRILNNFSIYLISKKKDLNKKMITQILNN